MHRLIKALLFSGLAVIVLVLYNQGHEPTASIMAEYAVKNAATDTGASNAVAAIYLNYRMFDSLFETLMLLISALGVIRLSWRSQAAASAARHSLDQFARDRSLIGVLVGFLYPLMLLISAYIILNGHATPGGGFQGGAILASVFISRYLKYPYEDIRIDVLQNLEKIFFFCILLLPVSLLFLRQQLLPSSLNRLYLIGMNLLIGLKVGAGLSIIFFRFVFYEGWSADESDPREQMQNNAKIDKPAGWEDVP